MNELRQIFNDFSKSNNFKPDDSQLALIDRLQEYLSVINVNGLTYSLKSLFAHKKKYPYRGMYIWGGSGRGKSMILNLFFNTLNTKNKLRMHFHEFMIEAHVQLNKVKDTSKVEDYLMQYSSTLTSNYKVIILDELQINNIADAMIVSRLFKVLIKRDCYVFFSSNHLPSELFKDGLQRESFLPFIDFIETSLEKYNLDNFTDYRFDNLKLGYSYLYPVNVENISLLNEITLPFTQDKIPYEQEIQVNSNRSIKSYKTYKNLAIFSFKELCEIPLGAIDYLALCRKFRLIVIEKIPHLTSENHNELLRFITLIDCMYESKTKLICLAECPIEEIYVSGKHVLEFRRTISRLQEMNSRKYFES